MNTRKILAELHIERDRINQAIAALEALDSQTRGRWRGMRTAEVSLTRRGRRRMSAAARKRISRAMKKRWAERKKKAHAA